MKIKISNSEAAPAYCEDNKKKTPSKYAAPNNQPGANTLQGYRIISTHFLTPINTNLR